MAEILIGTATTNASGIASFTNLPPGNYKYVRTTVKTGYTADTTERNVTISSATPVAQMLQPKLEHFGFENMLTETLTYQFPVLHLS